MKESNLRWVVTFQFGPLSDKFDTKCYSDGKLISHKAGAVVHKGE